MYVALALAVDVALALAGDGALVGAVALAVDVQGVLFKCNYFGL